MSVIGSVGGGRGPACIEGEGMMNGVGRDEDDRDEEECEGVEGIVGKGFRY